MNIQQVCNHLQVSPATIHRWVRIGLLKPPNKKRIQVTKWQTVNDYDDKAVKELRKRIEKGGIIAIDRDMP